MALLLSRIDSGVICLIGHWHSDTMLHYLHVTAKSLMQDFTRVWLMPPIPLSHHHCPPCNPFFLHWATVGTPPHGWPEGWRLGLGKSI
eukprot:2731352-Ditylum_brightwellii.AAC.1